MGKLHYWLDYALQKFKSRFWVGFTEMDLESQLAGQLIIYLVKLNRLKPSSPFLLEKSFKGSGSAKQRNYALACLMELIARLEMKQDPILCEKIVLETFKEEAPSKELSKLARKLISKGNRGASGFHQQIDRVQIIGKYLEEEFRLEAISGEEFFKEDIQLIEYSYLMRKWRHYIAARNYERIQNLPRSTVCKIDLSALNAETNLLTVESPLMTCWQKIANFQESPDWKSYLSLRESLTEAQKHNLLEPSELADAFRVLLNYLLPQVKNEQPEVLLEAFTLFNDNLETGLFLQNGRIHPRDLKNIISICVRLNKAEEARAFLDLFQDRILDDEKRQAYNYNCGVVLFLEGAFKKAGDQFLEVMHASDDFYLKADGKIYALRCLVELQVAKMDGSVNFFPGTEESFKIFYLRQKAFPEQTYQYYLAIFQGILEFSSIWGRVATERKAYWNALRLKLEGFPDPYLKKWLLDKIHHCLERG